MCLIGIFVCPCLVYILVHLRYLFFLMYLIVMQNLLGKVLWFLSIKIIENNSFELIIH